MKKLTKKEINALRDLRNNLQEQLLTLDFWFSHLTEEKRNEKRNELEKSLSEIKQKLN